MRSLFDFMRDLHLIGVDLGSEPDTAATRTEFLRQYWPSENTDGFANKVPDEEAFRNTFMGLPWLEESEDRLKREAEYLRRTEAYDRTVCTGSVINGVIWPSDGVEHSLITRHATAVRRELGLDIKPEAGKPVRRGWRYFHCAECGKDWRWPSRDAKSPSGENCPKCDEWCTPCSHVIDPSIPCDSSGNLTVRHDWTGNSDA